MVKSDRDGRLLTPRQRYRAHGLSTAWPLKLRGGYRISWGAVRMLALKCQLGQWDGMLISGRVGGFDPERQIPRECTRYWFSIERAWRGE